MSFRSVPDKLELHEGTEANRVVVAVAETGGVAIAVVDLVIGELEADRRGVLIAYANGPVGGVVDTGRVEVHRVVTEVGSPLVVPLLVRRTTVDLGCVHVERHVREQGSAETAVHNGTVARGLEAGDETAVQRN